MLRTRTQLLGALKTKTQSGANAPLSTASLELIFQNGGMPSKIDSMLDALVKRILKAKIQDTDLMKYRIAVKKLRDASFVLLVSSLTVSLVETVS